MVEGMDARQSTSTFRRDSYRRLDPLWTPKLS